jgi:hypothetical protein
VVADRPLWLKDQFATVVDVAVTYMLVSTTDSGITCSGTAVGTAKASGKIGDDFMVHIE